VASAPHSLTAVCPEEKKERKEEDYTLATYYAAALFSSQPLSHFHTR